MQKKDHFLLGEYLLAMGNIPCTYWQKQAFLFGCIEPDWNPLTYCRGSLQHTLFHGHHAENVRSHILKGLRQLEHQERFSSLHYFQLGALLHYIADSFTFPHNSMFPGGLKAHIAYERRLHPLFCQTIAQGSAFSFDTSTDLCEEFMTAHQTYGAAHHSPQRDCTAILTICTKVFHTLLCPAQTNPYLQPILEAVL